MVTPSASRLRTCDASHSSATLHSSTSSDQNKKFAGAIFSVDQPPELPQRLSLLSDWTLSPSKRGITRQFSFPSFSAAWRFMTIVADECKSKRHHPHWHNQYDQVTVEWTTRRSEGLSIKDVEMAEFCNQAAIEIGLNKEKYGSGTRG